MLFSSSADDLGPINTNISRVTLTGSILLVIVEAHQAAAWANAAHLAQLAHLALFFW